MYKIDKTKFTNEQYAVIQQILANGDQDKMNKIIILDSPEQEAEIQKFMDSIRTESPKMESEVKELMKSIRVRGVEPIATPEEEKEWNRLINLEANPSEKAKEELKQELDKMKVKYSDTASLEEIRNLRNEHLEATTEVETDEEVKDITNEVEAPEIADLEPTEVSDEEVKPKKGKKSKK